MRRSGFPRAFNNCRLRRVLSQPTRGWSLSARKHVGTESEGKSCSLWVRGSAGAVQRHLGRVRTALAAHVDNGDAVHPGDVIVSNKITPAAPAVEARGSQRSDGAARHALPAGLAGPGEAPLPSRPPVHRKRHVRHEAGETPTQPLSVIRRLFTLLVCLTFDSQDHEHDQGSDDGCR